jgi:hypothetical protein
LILAKGAKAGLNTSNYLWIVTQVPENKIDYRKLASDYWLRRVYSQGI